MINDLLHIFRAAEDMDKVVFDNYIMGNGLYFKISLNGEISHALIKRDNIIENDLFLWFKKRDYYSQLVNIDKPVDKLKKIHSNNIYSFFVKCNILPEVGDPLTGNIEKDKKILTYEQLIDSINRYYDILLEEKKDKTVNEILLSVELDRIDKDAADRNRNFLLNNFNKVFDIIKDYNDNDKKFSNKEYIKIFFEASEEEYNKEFKRYIFPKVFNKNDYNVIVDSKVMGLNNDNMSMNDKKPFLELKSTKFKVPFRVSLEDSLDSKKLFDWLNGIRREGKYVNVLSIPFDYDFKMGLDFSNSKGCIYIFRDLENGKILIKDYDLISSEVKLSGPFEYINYLGIEQFEEKIITDIKVLEKLVDEKFYNNQLRFNYNRNDIKPKKNEISSKLIDILFISKEAMKNYFHKGRYYSIRACINNVTMELIIDKIIGKESINWKNISEALNLRLNLLRYFKIGGYEDMGDRVLELYNGLREKLNSEELPFIESDDEYNFAAGQLARYIIFQSEAKNPKHNLLEPFQRAKTFERMNKALLAVYDNYSHALPLNFKKLDKLISIVSGYEAKSRIDQGLFLAGACYANILLEKKDKEEQ